MRKNAEKVLKAFEAGERCNGQTISTNGVQLYSYHMLIASKATTPDGFASDNDIDLLDYSKAPTATTRSHVRAAENYFRGRIVGRF